MEGPSMTYLLIPLLFISSLILSQTRALSVEETCKIVKDGTNIAYPHNCQYYATCVKGQPTYFKCEVGLLYNPTKGTCENALSVSSCITNPATMCEGSNNYYKADPLNCQNYCYCQNGVAKCSSCPKGQYYDPIHIKCVWKADSICVADSPCFLVQNTYIKDTSSCTGWLRCAGGQVVVKSNCPNGLYYNAAKGICDYKKNVPCSINDTPVSPSDTCKTAPNGETGSFYVAQKDSCRGYFYCKSVGAKTASWGQCPKGSNFDQTKQQCDDPNTVACKANRCDGATKQFMAIAGTNCKGYYNCSNNQITSQSTCPADYPYLNEVSGRCEQHEPAFKICTAAVQ